MRAGVLGDKDQLASVEAGAVLGDLCRDAEDGYYADPGLAGADGRPIAGQQRPEAGRTPAQPAGPASGDAAPFPRFGEGSGIGQLAGWSTASRPRGPRTAGQPDDVFCLASSGEQTSASSACCSTASTAAPKARRAIAATCATLAACARHRHRQRIPLGQWAGEVLSLSRTSSCCARCARAPGASKA
jgi:hypothetical protein